MRRSVLALPRSGHIHVIVVRLSARIRLGPLFRGLSRIERKLSRAFKDAQARLEFIVSRFFLRRLAAKYLGVNERDIELQKTPMGQPWLANPRGFRPYQLNVSLSHCTQGLAIAFARKARIGVDMEAHRNPPAGLTRNFLDAERELVEPHEVWDCWTRKEALLKAMGLGFFGLPDIPPLERKHHLVQAKGALWTVESCHSMSKCSLAIATEGFLNFSRFFTLSICSTIKRSF